jgi:hypothetical protein
MKNTGFYAALESLICIAMTVLWFLTGHPASFLFLSGCALGAGGTIAALRFAAPTSDGEGPVNRAGRAA